MQSLLHTSLSGYVLEQLIAAGGMAAVFAGRHEVTGQQVAVKVLARDLRNHQDPLARILQEGRIICSLLHEHIVRVFDYGTADENVGFVVMERLAGLTLEDDLVAAGAMEPDRVVFIGRQICAGLAAAHARDVFHRDIKPGNIMLVEGERHRDFVKLLDFGIAKLDAEDPAKLAATATGMTLGTPQYMSPEQAQAAKIDARSDVYQTGLVLYEMLVGEPPFWHKNPVSVMAMHLKRRPQPPRERRPEISAELEAVVLKCLEKDPEDRYQSAVALRTALDQLAVRNTAGDLMRTVLHGATRQHTVVGNLRLPTLGSPADLERYARNLSAVLEQLWPGGAPEDLRQLQGQLWGLSEAEQLAAKALTLARTSADALARQLEARLQPLERAIGTLEADKHSLEDKLESTRERVRRQGERTREADAEYADIYAAIEQHQAALYNNASGTGMVDFRDLFRDDISTRMAQLEAIFRQRGREDVRLSALRADEAEVLRRIADVRLQLAELNKSRLTIEAERSSALAALEFQVAEEANRQRAAERAVEHAYLQLGLAFRRAVSVLLAERG